MSFEQQEPKYNNKSRDKSLDVRNSGQPSDKLKKWNPLQDAELGNPQPSTGGNETLKLLSEASRDIFSRWSKDSTTEEGITPAARVEKHSEGDQTGSWSTLLNYANKLNLRRCIELGTALGLLSLASMMEGVHGQAVPGDKTSLGEAFTKEFPELAQVLKKPQLLETGTTPYDNAVHSEKLQGDKTLLQERSIANMDNLLGRQQATPTETVTITVTETATETATVHAKQSDIDNANKAGFTLGAVAAGFVPTFTVMSFAFVLNNSLWYKRYNRLLRRNRDIELD